MVDQQGETLKVQKDVLLLKQQAAAQQERSIQLQLEMLEALQSVAHEMSRTNDVSIQVWKLHLKVKNRSCLRQLKLSHGQ